MKRRKKGINSRILAYLRRRRLVSGPSKPCNTPQGAAPRFAPRRPHPAGQLSREVAVLVPYWVISAFGASALARAIVTNDWAPPLRRRPGRGWGQCV